MLGKLWKQEVKTLGRTVCGMYGVLGIATVLLIVLHLISRFADVQLFETIFMVTCSIYAITVIVAVVVNFVYLCYQFYRSMYSEQGYLTHTLPVKTTQILNVKVAVSFGYLFLTGVLSILSFVIIGMAADGIQVGTMFAMIAQAVRETAEILQIPGAVFVLFVLLMFVFGCLNALLLFFAGSSIGQLFHRSKGAYGIAAGIALYYCSQIVSLILVVLGYFVYVQLSEKRDIAWAMAGGGLLAFSWTVVYYMICRVIVQKHLNLE